MLQGTRKFETTVQNQAGKCSGRTIGVETATNFLATRTNVYSDIEQEFAFYHERTTSARNCQSKGINCHVSSDSGTYEKKTKRLSGAA